MTIRSAVLVSLLTGAVAMGAIACGGGSSTAISGPTSGTSGSSPIATTPSAQANATIMGTVVGGAGAASTGAIHALSALRVSVVGTSISATCDGSGHFTLSSVPTGHVQLHFQGPGVDARLDLDGLQDGETLTITVHVEGSNASIEPEGTGVEIHGMITMLSPLTVDGQSIMTDTDTRVVGADGQPLTLTDLKVGDEVEVNGTQQADGSILAGKIKVESGDEGTKQVEFHGTISALDPLTVAGKTIMTDANTRVVGQEGETLTLADLKVGDEVEVNGTRQADGSVLASRIKVESGAGQGEMKQVEFHGTISALDPLTVAGKTIMTDANTRVVGQEGETLTLADLKVGDEVEVNGTKQADGSVLASRIKVESGASD